VEHSAADESDVALVDLPSTSGAHWANRDAEVERRRAGLRSTPFRRPPAVNSFSDEPPEPDGSDTWDAFASGATSDKLPAWFGGRSGPPADASARHWTDTTNPSGRTSFGVTDEPISGARPDPVSPAAPLSPAVPMSPAGPMSSGAAPMSPAAAMSPAEPMSPAAPMSPDWPTGLAPAAPAASEPAHSRTTTADWPPADDGLGDLISGPGREIRPHRAGRGPAPDATSPQPRRRSRLAVAAIVALTSVVLLSGAVAGMEFFGGDDGNLTSMLKLGSASTEGKVATAPLDGRKTASFELVAATTKVTVRSADLGAELYKITSAGDSGTAPSPVLSENRVQLLLSPDGDGASGVVEVVLSSKVTWALRFVGGADEQIVNLTGGRLSSLDLAGGSRRVDLTLPAPTGTVPLRITGAIEDLSIASPAGNPVRVQVDSGAKTVAAGSRTLRDVGPGSTLTPKGWKVLNRYDVDAAARITLLSVRTAGE
jgi:hypothetical protein